MKKFLGAILIMGTAVLGGAQVAQAGGATDAALGLGAFAVFNQLVRGETVFNLFRPPAPVFQQPVVVAPPPPVVVYPPPRVVYARPPRPVYYAPSAVVYAPRPAPVYYVPTPVPPGHYKKIHPRWNKQYRPH